MLVLEPVPAQGKAVAVTLHGDIPYDTYPKTELTRIIDTAHKNSRTSILAAALGISRLEVHRLRNGSYRCDVDEVKRLLREGGINYEQNDP